MLHRKSTFEFCEPTMAVRRSNVAITATLMAASWVDVPGFAVGDS
jgi:hypothetical protein